MRFYKPALTLIIAFFVLAHSVVHAEPIYHEINYPAGNGPFPVVIALHTSGGFKTIKRQISKYTNPILVLE